MPKSAPKGYRKDGSTDLRRLPRVVTRPLGRHGADGLAEHKQFGSNKQPTIHLDIGLSGLKRLEILIHEHDHIMRPGEIEEPVKKRARNLARLLWREGYRHKDEYEA